MAIVNPYLSIITINGMNSQTERHRVDEYIFKKTQLCAAYKRFTSTLRHTQTGSKGMGRVLCKSENYKRPCVVTLMSKKMTKPKPIRRNKKAYYVLIKGFNSLKGYNNCKYLRTQHQNT